MKTLEERKDYYLKKMYRNAYRKQYAFLRDFNLWLNYIKNKKEMKVEIKCTDGRPLNREEYTNLTFIINNMSECIGTDIKVSGFKADFDTPSEEKLNPFKEVEDQLKIWNNVKSLKFNNDTKDWKIKFHNSETVYISSEDLFKEVEKEQYPNSEY